MRRENIAKKLPGGAGLWIFILSDLLLFGLFFALFAHDLAMSPLSFRRAQPGLSQLLGLFNTLLLLTGSWAVAMATQIGYERRKAARYLSGAAFAGILFLLLKSLEYAHLIAADANFPDSHFYSWYFILTGYHALHVIIAIVLLLVVARQYRRSFGPSEALMDAAGCYWHLVDLLWIGIFLLCYLL